MHALIMKEIKVFDYMIEKDLKVYTCDSWQVNPHAQHYYEIRDIRIKEKRQDWDHIHRYKNNIFVITPIPKRIGAGGMDEGTPYSFKIIKTKKEEKPMVKEKKTTITQREITLTEEDLYNILKSHYQVSDEDKLEIDTNPQYEGIVYIIITSVIKED